MENCSIELHFIYLTSWRAFSYNSFNYWIKILSEKWPLNFAYIKVITFLKIVLVFEMILSLYFLFLSNKWILVLDVTVFFTLISNINTQEWSQKHIKQRIWKWYICGTSQFTLCIQFFLTQGQSYHWNISASVIHSEIKKKKNSSLKGFWRCHPNHYIKYDLMTINDSVIDIRNTQYLNCSHYVVETQRLVMVRGKLHLQLERFK